MVEDGFGDVGRWNGSKKKRVEGLLEGRDIVDQFRYRFDVCIKPFLNDLYLIRKVDSGRSKSWRVEGCFFSANLGVSSAFCLDAGNFRSSTCRT
jgi:hypothetical protein